MKRPKQSVLEMQISATPIVKPTAESNLFHLMMANSGRSRRRVVVGVRVMYVAQFLFDLHKSNQIN